MKKTNPPLPYFHASRTHNLSGFVFTIVSAMGLCFIVGGAILVPFVAAAFANVFGALMAIGFLLALIGLIGGIVSCLTNAGRFETVRGVNLSLVAVGLGALGVAGPFIAIAIAYF